MEGLRQEQNAVMLNFGTGAQCRLSCVPEAGLQNLSQQVTRLCPLGPRFCGAPGARPVRRRRSGQHGYLVLSTCDRHVNDAAWCRSCASPGGVLPITRPFPAGAVAGAPVACSVKSCEKDSQDVAGELERLRERRSDQLLPDRDEILAKVVESFDYVNRSSFHAD